MSRAITVEEIHDLGDVCNKIRKLYRRINAMTKVSFPKAAEFAAIPSLNLDAKWSKNLGTSVPASMPLDSPFGDPTLDMMADIEPVSPMALEICGSVETFMPLESPMETSKERTLKGVAALPCKKIAEPIILDQVPAKKEPVKSLEAKDLENLLAAFKEGGMGVKDVKVLPSGATRITLDEFFGAKRERQTEFVRVRGLR